MPENSLEKVAKMFQKSLEKVFKIIWANGIEENVISLLLENFNKHTPEPEPFHSRLKQLILQYTVVGGMPAVFQYFIDTKDVAGVLRICVFY